MASKPQNQQRPDPHLRDREFLFKIAARAQKLLKSSPNPRQEMQWAERRLRENNLLGSDPPFHDPGAWTEQAIARNPDLMDQGMPYLRERGHHPENAETFESLILQLIPSEGGL